MIYLFITSLFLTLLITRILSRALHDIEGYGTKEDKSKTFTGFLRKRTGFDWHHIHLGTIILILTIPLILLVGFTTPLTISLAVAISLILDQIVPLINRKRNYFDKIRIIESITLHVIVSIIAMLF